MLIKIKQQVMNNKNLNAVGTNNPTVSGGWKRN
jgi:hypothetical protein